MTTRSRLAVLALALAPALTACVPNPAGRSADPDTSPASSAGAVVSTAPSPTGPTPVPTFTRPTPTPLPTFLVYTVREGDSLTAIARMFETTTVSVAIWNRDRYPTLDPDSPSFRPDRIQVGWQLVLIPNAEVDQAALLESPDPAGSADVPANGVSRVIHHGPRTSSTVALTFDMGGPTGQAVDILTWLADRDVPATVFATGRSGTTTADGLAALEVVGAHRDLFDLGNRTWTYPDLRELDDEAIRDQVDRTEAALLATINMTTKPWFRPPYGEVDDQIPVTVGGAGWGYTVLWEVDAGDSTPIADGGPTADAIVDGVLSDVQAGSIVRLDLGGEQTLAALPGIVAGLDDLGLTPVTLDTMLGG